MFRGIFLFILILIGILPLMAQNTPEELGEKIFDLFKNESYSFKELIPTENQLIDKVESRAPELVQNRVEDFRKEYPNLVKRFNLKCEEILGDGAAKGIIWQGIELRSIKPYKKNIGLKYEDQTVTVEITKLCIYFSSNQKEFLLVFNSVFDFDGQFLVSDDAIELEELKEKVNTY
jgi:hypothetical protein